MKLTPANIEKINAVLADRDRGVRASEIAASLDVGRAHLICFMSVLKAIGVTVGAGAKRGPKPAPKRPVQSPARRRIIPASEWEQRLSAL